MASFVTANSTEVPALSVRVLINDLQRSDVYCIDVQYGMGAEGSTATLRLPASLWDGGKSWLRGAKVEVRAGYQGNVSTVFAGYIVGAAGDMRGNVITAQARSLLGFADTVYVGQGIDDEYVAKYPTEALNDGVPTATGWTIKDILRDLFGNAAATWKGGGGSLPSQWRAMLKLGSLSVLSAVWNSYPLGDVTFRQSTLAEALEQLLSLSGTISFRERFTAGGIVYLDFFELADPTAPVRDCRVAGPGESIAGTNILSVSHDEAGDDVRTRMIGMGAPRRFILSVTTDHSTAPLVKDWDDSLEAGVLLNPESTKRGAESGKAGDETRSEFTEEKAKVFRRYLLPDELRDVLIDKDLGLELSDGRKLGIQVWKIGRIATESSGAWSSTLATEPTLLEGAKLDVEQGIVTLKEPAINFVSGSVTAAGDIVNTFEEAVVGVTVSVQGERLKHDTGVRSNGLSLSGISGAGLAEVVVNDSFEFIQRTNAGYAINGETFDAWIYDGSDWTEYTAASIVQDDTDPLRRFTEQALRERADVRTTYSIDTPYWQPGYRLGERIRIIGQDDAVVATHQIRSLSHNLTNNHRTSFSTDSAVPMVANEVLGA